MARGAIRGVAGSACHPWPPLNPLSYRLRIRSPNGFVDPRAARNRRKSSCAPAHIVHGSPIDLPAPEHCDVESGRATVDRFWPASGQGLRKSSRSFLSAFPDETDIACVRHDRFGCPSSERTRLTHGECTYPSPGQFGSCGIVPKVFFIASRLVATLSLQNHFPRSIKNTVEARPITMIEPDG